jgi:hypothetical protein
MLGVARAANMRADGYTAPGLGRASDDRPVAPATASTVGRRSPKGSGSAGPPATDQDRLARVFSGRAAQDAAYLHDTQSVHVPLGIPTRVAGSRTARGSTTGTWPSRRTRGVRSCSIAGSSVAGIAGPPGPRTRTLCRRSARSRMFDRNADAVPDLEGGRAAHDHEGVGRDHDDHRHTGSRGVPARRRQDRPVSRALARTDGIHALSHTTALLFVERVDFGLAHSSTS